MPYIKIHLTEHQLRALIYTLEYNSGLDLQEETFGSTDLEISMSPFGHFMQVKGYKISDLGEVQVEFPKPKKE